MKIKKETIINLSLVIILFIAALVLFNKSQHNSRVVETKIDTLSAEIQRMNLLTKSVADNLQHTIILIGNVSSDLENSGNQLEALLKEAGTISSNEKQKIKSVLTDIQNSRKSVEEEKKRALQLIGELNAKGKELK